MVPELLALGPVELILLFVIIVVVASAAVVLWARKDRRVP